LAFSPIEWLGECFFKKNRAVEQLVAHGSHNPEVVGSSPARATTQKWLLKMRYTWLLDNGHGGMINGAYMTDGKRSPMWEGGAVLYEGEFNRAVVNRLAELMTKAGYRYVKLTPQDQDISLQERVLRAKRWTDEFPCILVSVHANYGDGSGRAKGWEVFTTVGKTKSDKVATVFCNVFQERFSGATMRFDFSDGDPDKESNFYIIHRVSCPAILTENFFMDNRAECQGLLMTAKGRDDIAQAHFAAIAIIEEKGIE
jgi:N-acetylmuramoyl-L-alanine amidase